MRPFYVLTRPQQVYVVCAGIFVTALVVAEATAGKFFQAFELPFTYRLFGFETASVVMTAGVLAFPVTFIVTDVMNEYFGPDRKSTRLNSSHVKISYAVFCWKKKKSTLFRTAMEAHHE